jgi:hypothetical protein
MPFMSHVIRTGRHERQAFREERGQALVEFALVLPLLMLLILGLIDIGKAISYWNDETHLANEAARYAAVNNKPNGTGFSIEDRIESQASSEELRSGGGGGEGTISTPIQVTFCFPDTQGPGDPNPGSPDARAGHPVKVIVTSTYKWLGYLGFSVATSEIKATSTQRLETDWGSAPNGTIYDLAGPSACPP